MFDNMLCVIPARGGSKGIKDKNLRHIGGMHLVEHSILHALHAGLEQDQIVVSSDDLDILKIAKSHKVIAHCRPNRLCLDDSSSESALLDALDSYPIDNVLLLQPTSPIRFKNTLKNCIIRFIEGDYDSLLTVTKFYNLFWQEVANDEQCGADGWYGWHSTTEALYRVPRQKLTRENFRYFDNGNIYITQSKVLKEKNNRIGYKPCVYPISELEGMQIDDESQLELFQSIFNGSIKYWMEQDECA